MTGPNRVDRQAAAAGVLSAVLLIGLFIAYVWLGTEGL